MSKQKVYSIRVNPRAIDMFGVLKLIKRFERDGDLFEYLVEQEIQRLHGAERAAFEFIVAAWREKELEK